MQNLVPKLVSKTDILVAKKKRIASRKGGEWKDPMFSALSDVLSRVEWQLMCHAQIFAEKKGYDTNNIIMVFDGIELHRPSNDDKEVTTEFLDELCDYIKEQLMVSATFSGTRHVNGKPIIIPVTRTFQELDGGSLIYVKRLTINKKRKLPSHMENDKRSRIE